MFSFARWLRGRGQSPKTRHRFRPCIEALEERCVPTTYSVTNLLDAGPGSLRDAITQANTNNTGTPASPDIIQFNTAGGTINVGALTSAALPNLTDIADIDATTATGYSGTPVITLDGSGAGAKASGLTISGGSSTVKALAIDFFGGSGVVLTGASGDTVLSSYIGISADGTVAPNRGDGIDITTSGGDTIGSATGIGGNVISGNGGSGINLFRSALNRPDNCLIIGNRIGTNVAGTAAIGNGGDGITSQQGAGNTIGGAAPGARNLISGNAGNGISMSGLFSSSNVVIANFIGTDVTGSTAVGNGGSGIVLNFTSASTIGGNAPTGSIKDAPPAPGKPPDGNLISGNGQYGILITNVSNGNTLSGNFVGTDITGIKAVGNALDGIAITDNASNNSLLGTTATQQPFVFLNLVSGNGGNGLRIDNSNNNTIQANAFGIADDNVSALGNRLDGVLIEGSSAGTQFGGPIPLGNISSGNGRNGVEIADTASGTTCFNTFAGTGAFTQTSTANVLDGFLITSTGGNNVLRTNVISGNGANGIHLAGNATGVTIEDAIVGLTTNGKAPMPNGADGVLLDGNANHNLIGGQQVSVIMQNAISANGENGIAIVGNASNNVVNQSFIGTDLTGTEAMGNAGAGVFLGGNANHNTIGDTNPVNQNVISANFGSGIQVSGASQATQLIGNLIGTDRTGQINLGNHANGVHVSTNGNQIGGTASGAGNTIAFSPVGVVVDTGATGNGILSNSMFGNQNIGILLQSGANNNQPAPVLTSESVSGKINFQVQVTGSIAAAPNTTYTIQLFSNASGSAVPQGQTLLATLNVTTNAQGVASFVSQFTAPLGVGPSAVTATATDPNNNTSAFSVPIGPSVLSFYAVGADAGGAPVVNVYNGNGLLLFSFLAYASNFTGGVRVAMVNGEIITGPGPGGGADIRVFTTDGQQVPGALGSFMAFPPGFTGGVYVAGGDVNGDGRPDIIVGAGAGGGPVVTVFSGADGSVLSSFMAYDTTFTGGVTVAAGNVTGTGLASVICGPGPGGGPNVRVFSGTTGNMQQSFFAFDPSFTGGVYVAAADERGIGRDDIIVGAGAGGGPVVNIFNGLDDAFLANFVPFSATFFGGVRVGAFTQNDTFKTFILTGAGPGGAPQVSVFDGVTLAQQYTFNALDPTFTGGVFVAGA